MPSLPNATLPSISAGVSTDSSRLSSKANLDAAGKKFEAVFTSMMVKSMRSTHLAEDDLFGSKGMDTFKEMQDQQLAQNMAQHAPLGIGKAMTDFLGKAMKIAAPAVPASTVAEPAAQASTP
jgi:flagellar protein FlgJ